MLKNGSPRSPREASRRCNLSGDVTHQSMARSINKKGRNHKKGRFVRLPHPILQSEAYRSLDCVARALLTELVMLENGRNNGSLYLSTRDAAARLGLSDTRPAMRAFDDLVDRGLIMCTKDSSFNVKAGGGSRARCWRLTWLAWNNRPPSNEWERYQAPPKSKARKKAERGLKALKQFKRAISSDRLPDVDFTSAASLMAEEKERARVKSPSAGNKNGGNQGFLTDVEFTAHTAVTTTLRGSWWRERTYFRINSSRQVSATNDNGTGRQGPGSPN